MTVIIDQLCANFCSVVGANSFDGERALSDHSKSQHKQHKKDKKKHKDKHKHKSHREKDGAGGHHHHKRRKRKHEQDESWIDAPVQPDVVYIDDGGLAKQIRLDENSLQVLNIVALVCLVVVQYYFARYISTYNNNNNNNNWMWKICYLVQTYAL